MPYALKLIICQYVKNFVCLFVCVLLSILYRKHPHPTRSLGINRNSEPCFKNTFPAVCCGLMPTPSFVMMALVCAGTLNSSAANFRTAVKGASSGTLNTRNGSFGSDVKTTLNVTFALLVWLDLQVTDTATRE